MILEERNPKTTEEEMAVDELFEDACQKFWQEFGKAKKMVLSTSLDDAVTSRMMSVIHRNGKLYFQTDCTFRKYHQLKNNPRAALCIDNIQIEGVCNEIGNPVEHAEFCNAYRECFADSFYRYTLLKDERLFVVEPTFIERWIYREGVPYMQILDIKNRKYIMKQYICKARD